MDRFVIVQKHYTQLLTEMRVRVCLEWLVAKGREEKINNIFCISTVFNQHWHQPFAISDYHSFMSLILHNYKMNGSILDIFFSFFGVVNTSWFIIQNWIFLLHARELLDISKTSSPNISINTFMQWQEAIRISCVFSFPFSLLSHLIIPVFVSCCHFKRYRWFALHMSATPTILIKNSSFCHAMQHSVRLMNVLFLCVVWMSVCVCVCVYQTGVWFDILSMHDQKKLFVCVLYSFMVLHPV